MPYGVQPVFVKTGEPPLLFLRDSCGRFLRVAMKASANSFKAALAAPSIPVFCRLSLCFKQRRSESSQSL
jgi:hypothetical protein